MQVDVGSKASISTFALNLGRHFQEVHVLVNNAACAPVSRQVCAWHIDGVCMCACERVCAFASIYSRILFVWYIFHSSETHIHECTRAYMETH
jgi:hypothetical protein